MRKKSSPYGRAGSKYRLAPWIINKAWWIPHRKWGELFAGTCSLTLQKEPVQWEFLNDLDRWISNFLSVLRDREQKTELLRLLRYSAWERNDFETCTAIIKGHLPLPEDSVEQARTFLVANQQSFNKSGRTHSISDSSSGIPKWKQIGEHIEFMADRIQDCQILSLDYAEVLALPQVNDPHMLVYADPPYCGVEKTYYATNRTDGFDHVAFREKLNDCQASIMVSYEDCPEIRELYSVADSWQIEQKEATRTLANDGQKATELVLVRMSDWAQENALKRPRRRRKRDIFANELASRGKASKTDQVGEEDAA